MKDYRDKEMKNLMFILFFLFLFWCTPILSCIETTEEQSNYAILASALESAVISAVLSSGTLLCDCLISSSMKDKLVGLFFIPRAGETIFTRIKSRKLNDNRFQNSDAADMYEDIIQNLPSNSRDRKNFENKHWYRIYHQYQQKGQVIQSQKDYLMCRDLYTEALVFLLIYILALFVFPSAVVFSKKFILLLLLLGAALCCCTHLKMNRFVNTVIAVDIASRSSIHNPTATN